VQTRSEALKTIPVPPKNFVEPKSGQVEVPQRSRLKQPAMKTDEVTMERETR
jgi:hypothetical protein